MTRSGWRRRRGRCSRRRPSAASASTVDATCSDSSLRPCTSCSSWTANSTSRSPPVPSLSSRVLSPAGTSYSTRRRIACTSGTKSSRSHAVHTIGISAAMYSLAQFRVAGGGSRLHQRLELPGLGPPLVVGDVRLQRPDQLPAACLRAAAPRRPRRRRRDANRIISPATLVATESACSATKMTSTSLT